MGRVAQVVITRGFALAWLLVQAAAPPVQDSIPESKLKPLREATVYIRSGVGPDMGTGSGFLIRKVGEVGFVVTNAHVVSTLESEVIFFPGTEREATLRGRLVGFDTNEDLAILRVEMKGLPAPLDLAARPALRETAPVTILGFPYGALLQSGRRHPTATITLGTISSLTGNLSGDLGWIQLDGSVNPGNSGGPVVDRTGDLIGVTVAMIRGTKISFAIPSDRVERLLAGRVTHVLMTPGEQKSRSIRMRVFGGLLDPLENVKEATLLYLPLAPGISVDTTSEKGPIVAGMTELTMRRDPKGFEAEVELTSDTGQDGVYVYQARYIRKDKRVLYTTPRQIRAEFSKTEGPKKDKDDWIDGNPPKEDKGKPPSTPGAAGGTPAPAVEPFGPAPKPEAIGRPAAGRPQKTDLWTLRPLTMSRDTQYAAPAFWSEDAKHAWLMGVKGMVHKVSLSDLTEECRLAAGRRVDALGASREGMVLRAVPETGLPEIWLLDRSSLEVKARVVAPGTSMMITNAHTTQVFVVMQGGTELRGIELPSGRETFQVKTPEIRNHGQRHPTAGNLTVWHSSIVSPDGRYLLVAERSFHRFVLSSGAPALEESGPAVLAERIPFAISADSRYVSAYCRDTRSLEGFPQAGICVFKIDDFRKPVAHVRTAGTFLAFDRAAGRVYLADPAGGVAACNPNGDVLERFPLARPGATLYGMTLHPEGRKGFLFCSDGTFWFEMAK